MYSLFGFVESIGPSVVIKAFVENVHSPVSLSHEHTYILTDDLAQKPAVNK